MTFNIICHCSIYIRNETRQERNTSEIRNRHFYLGVVLQCVSLSLKRSVLTAKATRTPLLNWYFYNINWRDVKRKNVVNKVDMSCLRISWQNDPYKNQHTERFLMFYLHVAITTWNTRETIPDGRKDITQ